MAASPTMPNTESTTALQSEMRKSRYRTEIRKIHTEYPYHKAIGKKSPYNGRIIWTENDYDLYCHCYALFRMYEKDMAEADNKLLNANVSLSLERKANAEFYEAAYKRFRFMRIVIYVLCAALAYFVFLSPFFSSSDESAHHSSSSVSSSSSASSSESSESSSDSSGNGPQRPDGYSSNGSTDLHVPISQMRITKEFSSPETRQSPQGTTHASIVTPSFPAGTVSHSGAYFMMFRRNRRMIFS